MLASLILGRALLGLCFVLDGTWWLYTWDVRAAYFDRIGVPAFMIVPVALVYISCGGLLFVGRAVRPAVLPLMAVAGLIAMLLHTDLGPGGIGEYPLDQHAQINVEALLVQITLVGVLMLAFGAPGPRLPIDLRAIVLGRALLGGYFVARALWQAHYYDARLDAGAALLPLVIAVQIVFGLMLAAGRSVRGDVVPLALVLVFSTVAVHGNLSADAAHPPNFQVHRWFVAGSVLAGLLLLFGLGPAATPPPPTPEIESDPPSVPPVAAD